MGTEDDKDAQPTDQEIEYDPDDIRSILLAERVDKIYREVRENKPIRGKESEYRVYQRMGPLRSIAMLVLLFQILFSKPLWCREKGQNIDDNCRKDTNDVNYFRSKLPVFDTGMDTYINITCLLFLAISRLYRLRLNNSSDDAVSASVTCLVFALVYVSLKILHSMGGFLYINIEDILTMLFILVYNDAIRRAAMRLVKIAVESIEILIIFASVLLAFACLARVLFFDYDEVKDFDYNFAAFNYGSFSSSFYSMIVTVSTTSFPGNMLKAYKSSRPFAFFYILNTFVVNLMMLNLILATFYFYYQNFYTESVKKLNSKKNLLLVLHQFKGKIVDDKLLKYIVESYIENADLKFEDLNKEYFKESTSVNKSGIDSYSILISLQSHYLYQLAKGVLNITIVCLTMNIIDIFHTGPGADNSNKSTTILKFQVILLFLSLMEQSVGIVVRGFRQTFKSLLLTFEVSITLIALVIGLLFVSFGSLDLLLAYDKTSSLFKLFALATIGKTISVIMFLRIIREIRIVLDVLVNSAIFLIDVIGMMGIVMLLFSSVGITLFGGVMNSQALVYWKEIIGPDDGYDEGIQYLNFNDYFNSLLILLTVILSGWQDPLKMMCFSMPNRNYNHNYFFVAFFVCANLFLLNVLIGFIIDNIVAYLSEDIIIENPEDAKFKSELKSSIFGKMVSMIKEKTIDKIFGEKDQANPADLDGIILTDKT